MSTRNRFSKELVFVSDLHRPHSVVDLEDTEGFLSSLDSLWFVGHNVETNGFGKRTALSNGDNITFLDIKGWGAVNGNVLVTLFETTLLGDVVQIIPSNNDCSLHLGGDNHTVEDTSSNGNIASEGALLVDVAALNGCGRGLDSQTNFSHETHGLLALIANSTLAGHEDGILLLVCLLPL